MPTRRVDIISKKNVFQKFIFRINEVTLRFEKYDGTMSKEMVRLNLDRGDSVAAVIHDTRNDVVVLTEQFRYSTYDNGPGWLLELPAGIIRRSETPENAMRRELTEETGYLVDQLKHIYTFYPSPGGTSERIVLFYAAVTRQEQHASTGGGIENEGEDIKVMLMSPKEVFERLDTADLQDAKTIIGLQWLRRHLA